MPAPPPVQLLSANVLNELVLEANIDSSKFSVEPWASKLIVSNFNNGKTTTGVAYKALMPLVPQSYAKLYGDYILAEVANRYAGFITLTFVRNMSDAEKNTPYQTITYTGNHRWPPILKFLIFLQDRVFTRSTNGVRNGVAAVITGPTYYVRQGFIPEVNEGTRFVEEYYYSNTPYAITQQETPVTGAIYYDMPGIRGSFEECLHPGIDIPAVQSANNAVIIGNNAAVGGTGELGGQHFPATNFKEWTDYVLTDRQKYDTGWKRTRIRVYPPPVPRIVVR